MPNMFLAYSQLIVCVFQAYGGYTTSPRFVTVARHRRRMRRMRRAIWVKPWIGRRHQFGLYDQLMVELRNEDHRALRNFLHMPPEMYDELLERVGPIGTRQHTRYREPLEPGLKLALTLSHLASGSRYSTMQYGWRVPNNIKWVIVCQLCQAMVDKYLPEVMTCPTTPEEWRCIYDKFLQKWNFPMPVWHKMESPLLARISPRADPSITTIPL